MRTNKNKLNAGLSIEEVSVITGLSPFVLRAWEKRYKAVIPKRNGPRRTYSFNQVEKLKGLKKLVDSGIPIRKACALIPEEFQGTLSIYGRKEKGVDELRSLIKDNCLEEFRQQIGEIRGRQSVEQFLIETICPILADMGLAVERGEFDIAHEHAISAILREQVIRVRRVTPNPKLPTLAFCTPVDDFHEMGILIAARLAESKGFPIVYLGPSLPVNSLTLMIQTTRIDHVIIGAAPTKNNILTFPAYVHDAVKKAGKKTQISIAGPLASRFLGTLPKYPTMKDYLDFLNSQPAILDLANST